MMNISIIYVTGVCAYMIPKIKKKSYLILYRNTKSQNAFNAHNTGRC